jgi:MoaA/NifB/PqqE/SkfB family radical SAM enzyme
MSFIDIDIEGKRVMLSGNYGDPIYHPDFIDLVRELKKRQPQILIVTNGSYKKINWWTELTNLLDANDKVVFSIDGTPENFTQYRQNADWESIRSGIEVCVQSRCRTAWKYIPFSFNQTDIEQIKQFSLDLGMDSFDLEKSDRFVDNSTSYLRPSSEFVGSRYQSQVEWQDANTVNSFSPKCHTGKEHFITADGFYSPCCYLADHRFYYKTQFGKQKKQYNIQEHTLSRILSESTVVDFYQKLEQQSGCQFNCPG